MTFRDPDEPITDCHMRPYGYEYIVSATLADRMLVHAPLDVVIAEVQQALFWDGACTTGFFELEGRWDNRIAFRIKRHGCDDDYHDCYAGMDGHDGSNRKAIAQLQGEIRQAIEGCPTEVLLKDIFVEQRYVIN